MTAVVGCVIATGLTVAILWIAVGRGYVIKTHPSVDLGAHGYRHVSIMGNSVATALIGALRPLARSDLTARPLGNYGHFLMLGYAQGAVVPIGFLLLAVLGLA